MPVRIDVLLDKLASPARRAIQSTGASTLEELVANTKLEIANSHGIGPNAMQKIARVIREYGLTYKNP